MITADTIGAPNWVDMSTPDIDATTNFYKTIFDWEIETAETPMGEYRIGKAGGRQVAGMMQALPGAGDAASWTLFFNVGDLEPAISRIVNSGGDILQAPFDIPSARIAVAADSTGAMFGLFSGPEINAVWLSRDVGAVSWVEELTRDPTAAQIFYGEVFGWASETQDVGGTMYTTFKLDDDPVAGMMLMPSEVPADAPAHWSAYFTVADCEATVERAVELGGAVLVPTREMEMGKFAVLADPLGASFDLMEYAK